MNLSRVPDRTTDEVRFLVEAELRKIANASIVQGLQTFLVEPRIEMRTWEWGKPLADYPVWIVAESSRYDYGIVFSDYGFAPGHPWGLVFLSHNEFNADYCWYPTLEDAYKDSRLLEEHEETQAENHQTNIT
ncbi:MAG: hypothetical protein ABR905_14240 [Terracidiphilus sp.]